MKLSVLALSCLISTTYCTDVRLTNLHPDDAAEIINQPQYLQYARLVQTSQPGVRFNGGYPERVVQNTYLANQYHGQDGLGAYAYGYSIPNSAKHEKKERRGDLNGAYSYITANGKEIKVQYWDNGHGFQQVDNTAEVIQDPAVQAEKANHLRRWHQEAYRNSQPPQDPNAKSWYDQIGQYQYPAIQQLPSGQWAGNQAYYDQANRNRAQRQRVRRDAKGFFYSFDYPVGAAVGREDADLQAYAARNNAEAAYNQNRNLYG